jgi:DNA replicative helicase MCM subunit Mcm2 (Cdc46/Mcm family)
MTRLLRLSVLVGLCVALTPAAWAHHSQSEYDLRSKVDVEGTVTKVEWRSPHAWVYVNVTDDKGQTVNWSFELPSPVTLMRRGWTRDSLKPGDRVKVSGAPAKNFPDIAIANFIKDSSGKPLFTGVQLSSSSVERNMPCAVPPAYVPAKV